MPETDAGNMVWIMSWDVPEIHLYPAFVNFAFYLLLFLASKEIILNFVQFASIRTNVRVIESNHNRTG